MGGGRSLCGAALFSRAFDISSLSPPRCWRVDPVPHTQLIPLRGHVSALSSMPAGRQPLPVRGHFAKVIYGWQKDL